MRNALTFDVEDWYQSIGPASPAWDGAERRLERGLVPILDALRDTNTRATFFILSACARDYPDLIRRIADDGHEIGTHLETHDMVYNLSLAAFEAEIAGSVKLLREVTGAEVKGHRAPFFSITKDSFEALGVLRKHGLAYDASIYPGQNYRYGIAESPRTPYYLAEFDLAEFPVSVRDTMGQQLGIGGAYFRIMPYAWTRNAIRSINAAGHPAGVYLHPWEFDPTHPRNLAMGRVHRVTHYFNLASTYPRFRQLLRDFAFAPMGEILADLTLPTRHAFAA
ncbi:MAG: DUF3473 domain-containing protein [bacterium]